MQNKTRQELYQLLSEGTEKEVQEAREELENRDETRYQNNIKNAVSSICARNFSHNIGKYILKKRTY